MTMRGFGGALVLAASLCALLAAAPRAYGADAVAECIAANDRSLDLRKQGKLIDARRELAACAVDACPAEVQTACRNRMTQVNLAIPTVVFEVKDGAGQDLAQVTLSVDGQPPTSVGATALSLDPGEHKFTFVAAGQPPVEKSFVLREGEKDRRERIVIGAEAAAASPAPATTAPPSADTGSASAGKTQRILGVVIGAAGVVGLGVGSIFGLTASSSWSSAKSECGTPSVCPNYKQAVSDHDSASSAATISTVGMIAGGVLLAGGIVLFLTAPRESPSESAAVRIVPTAGPGAAAMNVTGMFQ